MTIEDKLEQPEKALPPIEAKYSGNSMLTNDLQPLNVLPSINV